MICNGHCLNYLVVGSSFIVYTLINLKRLPAYTLSVCCLHFIYRQLLWCNYFSSLWIFLQYVMLHCETHSFFSRLLSFLFIPLILFHHIKKYLKLDLPFWGEDLSVIQYMFFVLRGSLRTGLQEARKSTMHFSTLLYLQTLRSLQLSNFKICCQLAIFSSLGTEDFSTFLCRRCIIQPKGSSFWLIKDIVLRYHLKIHLSAAFCHKITYFTTFHFLLL